MVAVLATRQLSLGAGSVGAALGGGIESDFAGPAGNVVGLHLRVFAGHVRRAERLPGFGGAALRIELIQQADRGRQLFDSLGHEAGDPGGDQA